MEPAFGADLSGVKIHQIISAEEAPRFIYGGKALANLFAVVPS
jgi:hypothetical protein